MYFRQFQAEDASLLFELDCDPEVMRYISKGQPTRMEQIQQEILPRWRKFYEHSPPSGFWAAHLRGSGEFIGWFHLRPDKISPVEMELGYRLKRSAWGGGLATEGSRALITQAFGDWNYAKVVARTLIGNLASRRVMAKAGLKFEEYFTYGTDLLPDWLEVERRAVKYSATRNPGRTTDGE